MVPGESRDHGKLPLAQAQAGGRLLARVRLGMFSARRGSGLWPTGQRMARSPAVVRSLTAAAVMSGGAAWSSVQAPQAKSPCPACDCRNSPPRPGAVIAASTDSERPRGWQLPSTYATRGRLRPLAPWLLGYVKPLHIFRVC